MADQEIQNAVTRHAQNDMKNVPTSSHDAPEVKAPKIGAEHATAMLKLGAHELTQALAAFPDSNVRPMEEPGIAFGNTTMPHIVEPDHGLDAYNAQLDQAASRGGDSPERGRSR